MSSAASSADMTVIAARCSRQQLLVLAAVYRTHRLRTHQAVREDLHSALWGHVAMQRGPKPPPRSRGECRRRESGQSELPLSAAQRTALSRLIRRLMERGLVNWHRSFVHLTDVGKELVESMIREGCIEGPMLTAGQLVDIERQVEIERRKLEELLGARNPLTNFSRSVPSSSGSDCSCEDVNEFTESAKT